MADSVDSRLYQTVLENAPTLVINADRSGTILYSNRDDFSFTQEELKGKSIYDFMSERYVDGFKKAVTETITTKTPQIYEFEDVSEAGDRNWFRLRIGPIVKEGVVDSIILISNSITEQKQFEEKLRDSELKLRSIFNATLEGIIVADEEGNIVEWNKAQEEMFGLSKDEVLGKKLWDIQYKMLAPERRNPEAQQRIRQSIQQYFETGEASWIREVTEVEISFSDGKLGTIQQFAVPMRTSKGQGLCSFIHDITDRRIAEEEREKSDQQWKALAEVSQQGITILQEGKIVYANPAYANIVGRSVDELYSYSVEETWDIVHPDDRRDRQQRYREFHKSGIMSDTSVYRIIRPDGEIRWIDSGVSIIEFNGIPAMQRIAIDVTERVLAEEAVAEQRDRAEMYLQLAGVIFIALDEEGKTTLFNRKGTEVLGYTPEEILGKLWFETIIERERNKAKENFSKIVQGELEQIDYVEREHITKSGDTKIIAWHASVLRDINGKITGVLSSGEDITEKRAAQMELKASQEMLQLVMNNIPQHVFWKDLSSVYLGCNDSFAEVYVNGKPEDVIGKSDYEIQIDSAEADRFRNADRIALESPQKRYEEIEQTFLPNGEEAWFRTVKVPLHDGEGNEIGILGTLEDVTEKRKAELDLIASERKLRTLIGSLNDLVFVFDENNVYTEYYAPDTDDLYVPPSEFMNRNIVDVLPEDVSIPYTECMERVRKSGRPETFDYMLPDHEKDRWFSANNSIHEDGKSIVSVIREITARVEAAHQLEEANSIINMSPTVAILWKNKEKWPVEYISENARDLFGYSADELMSGDVLYSDIIHPDDLPRVTDEVQGFSADALCESFVHEPYRIIRSDGEVRWITDDTVIRKNKNGEITHYQGVVADITNRIHIMEALQESETKYRTVIEQSLMGLVIIDSNSREVVLTNPLVAKYTGTDIDKILSMKMEELVQIIDKDDLSQATKFLERCIKGEQVEEIAVRLVHPDGDRIWVLIDGSPVTFEGKVAVQLSMVDITDRMRALENLEKERASFRSIAESAIKAQTTSEMGRLILEGLINALNLENGTLRLYNEKKNVLHPTAFIGLPEGETGKDAPVTPEASKEWAVTKIALSKEPMIITNAKSDPRVQEYIDYLDSLNIGSFVIYPLLNKRDELLGTFTFGSSKAGAISTDDRVFFDTVAELLATVVERKLTEQAYQMSVRRYRDLLTDMSEGIGVMSFDEKFLFVNDAFANIIGYTTDELIGTDSIEVIYPEDIPKIKSETELRKRGTSSAYQARMVRKDGDIRFVRISAIPSRDDDGNIDGTVAIITDITDRVKAENEVRQLNAELAQRVEERTIELKAANKELESFAYSVSHDLRAPLRVIDGFSNAVLEDYYDQLDETGKDYLKRIQNGAKGMSSLIDAILNLSRVTRADMERVDVDLSKLSEEAVIELKESEPERDLVVDIQENMTMRCDKRLMRIALQNLIGNAWKFTKTSPSPRIDIGMLESEGEKVFYVKDNGVGFETEQKEKLFKPFQRLHKADDFEGSGIGLATVERVIARHGGRIWAESHAGMGATFYFTLKTGLEAPEGE